MIDPATPAGPSPTGPSPSGAPDVLDDLHLLLRSRYGLIHLATAEEERARSLLRHLADRAGVPFFRWTSLEGLVRDGMPSGVYDTENPRAALDHVRASGKPALYHFHGLDRILRDDPAVAELLGAAARTLEADAGAVVLTGEGLELPPELRRRTATLRLPGPGAADFEALLEDILRDMSSRRHIEVSLTKDEAASLLNQLKGLTLLEAEKVLTKAIVEDGKLASRDILHVIEAKQAIVEREGLLEYYPAESGLDTVADLTTLKAWLAKRKAVVRAPERAREFGLDFPRGVLLLGVPGCGKSLAAKAVAWEWSFPLLKLDPSNLYNKFIGESERNFKRAMETAEQMAPVVLWVDELEKAFAAGGDADGGVSQRILGTFLSWMQERRGDVFVVATANDIDGLPPEFMRKGRFDEIFFVDLPDEATREAIFEIHLSLRKQAPASFDLEALATATEGFSGAEIEEVVVAALYTAFSEGRALDQSTLAAEAKATRPLSVTMAERVSHLRRWARGRTVLAN